MSPATRAAAAVACLLPALALAQLADGGVTVVSGARARPPGGTSLRGAEARETPLTEHDALKAVQTFPGVGRAALGSGDLAVWGAAPGETRVEVDGVELPALFHLGGYRSVLSPELVGRVELEPAPFRAEVGRSLGGLVKVDTAAPPDGLHGSAAADLSQLSAQASLAGPEGSLTAAGRYGLLDRVVGPFLQGVAADRYALPASWDAQLRGAWRPTGEDELQLLALAVSDRLTLAVGSDDPSLARGRTQALDTWRVGLTWRRGREQEVFSATAFAGQDLRRTTVDTPLARAALEEAALVSGLKARWRATLAPGVSALVGLDSRFTRSALARSGPLTVPGREGDVAAFGQPLPDAAAADAWEVSALDAAVHLGLDLSLGPVELGASLRLSALAAEVSRASPEVAATPGVGLSSLDFALEPRLAASWAATSWLTVTAAGGLSHQEADAADRSAVFGTPGLAPARGAHGALGLAAQPWPLLSVEAVGFLRTAWSLAVRHPGAQAALAGLLLAQGEGRAWGLQVTARLRPWNGLAASLAYTLGRAERREGPEAAWRLADFDQTHVLAAAARWTAGAFAAGARLRWATGLPRTPVTGATFDLRRGVFEPRFGAQNSARLPDFLELDLEAGYRFEWGALFLEPFLELLDVTARQNVEEWAYDSTFSRRASLLGLPFFGTLGLRGGW